MTVAAPASVGFLVAIMASIIPFSSAGNEGEIGKLRLQWKPQCFVSRYWIVEGMCLN